MENTNKTNNCRARIANPRERAPVMEENLNSFVDDNFGKRIQKFNYKPKISVDDSKFSGKSNNVQGTTIPTDVKTASTPNIYLRSSVLNSQKFLYFTLDHELHHAFHISQGYFALWTSVYGNDAAVAISEKFAYTSSINVANQIYPQNGSLQTYMFHDALNRQFNTNNSIYLKLIK